MKQNQKNQTLVSVFHSRRPVVFGLIAVGMTSWIQAEPFIDDLENLSHISNDSGNCVFAQDDQKRLIVTKNDDPMGPTQAAFNWNIKKGREEGFSLDPADEQFIFEIKGIVPVTNGKQQAKLFVVPFFGTATKPMAPYLGGDAGSAFPVEPDEQGNWRLDISEIVNNNFSEDDRPTQWFPLVGIDSSTEAETGFGFVSFGAVGPETPSSTPVTP